MAFESFICLSLAILSTIFPASAAYPPFGPYNITDYVSNCIPGECYYSFNITFAPGPSYPPAYQSDTEPAFGPTKCEGKDQQSGFVACADSTISTNLIGLAGCRGNLTIQHSKCSFSEHEFWDTKVFFSMDIRLTCGIVWLVPEGPETRAAQYTAIGTKDVDLYLYDQPGEFQIYANQEQVAAWIG